MGLVIGSTKHYCVNITLSITKSNIMTLFVTTFLLVKSIISNCFSFCTFCMRY